MKFSQLTTTALLISCSLPLGAQQPVPSDKPTPASPQAPATAPEDEQDLSKMELDLHLFEVYTRGYLEAANALTDTEIAMLPMGALAVTLELATRFLKDYLDGDLYFKTTYPEHNLVRARTQMKLARDMQQKWEDMNRIVAKVAAQIR